MVKLTLCSKPAWYKSLEIPTRLWRLFEGHSSQDINRRIGRASSVMSSLQHIWKNQRLSLTTKTHHALVQSVYAGETWSLLSTDSRALEAFHMKCQRHLLQIKLHQFIRNEDISATTSLPSISDTISHRRNALFGHVARLPDDVPAHKVLNCHINLLLGRPPSSQWRRRPGRPRSRWVDQLRTDNNLPPAVLWRCAVNRGHRGATLQPLPAKR